MKKTVILMLFLTIILLALSFNSDSKMANCTFEDSSDIYPCIWDAKERGNGEGQSYILTGPISAPIDTPIYYTGVEGVMAK